MDTPRYYLADDQDFVIERFNDAPAFASFLPGIAGPWGVPLWVFYVNRGQCVSSLGVLDKNGSIMEFQPANKAYRSTALLGFRTFLKVDGRNWEPFASATGLASEMRITPHDLRLVERNPGLGLSIEVEYFTVPNERFAALARRVRVMNTARKARTVEAVDGMPALLPCGLDNGVMKNMSNLIEAWCAVERLEPGVEFYKTKTELGDATEVTSFSRGNFYAAFVHANGRDARPATLVSPKSVFGPVTGFETPAAFFGTSRFRAPAAEAREGYIPAAFSHAVLRLGPGASAEIVSLIGQAPSPAAARSIARRACRRSWFEAKRIENRQTIEELTANCRMKSSSPELDMYARQNFLDNVMRGGLPIDVAGRPFYVYYRAHGDTEREYNDFKTVPSYLSEGNGNYRDINQNRRSDNFFHPGVAEMNVVRFVNLLQLDGFNPLVVRARYLVLGEREAGALLGKHLRATSPALVAMLVRPFVIGNVLKRIEDDGLRYRTSRETLAGALLDGGRPVEESFHAQGYWTDHWFYNLDLLESYEGVNPEGARNLLFRKDLTFYDSAFAVKPRKDKYVVKGRRMWQQEAVHEDPEKRAMIGGRAADPCLVRAGYGKGGVYRTTLAAKFLCLVANKAASLDAFGIGMEMESEKPDWCDAMNGLPGRFGSSLSESLELKRLCLWLLKHIRPDDRIDLAVEIRTLLDGVTAEARRRLKSGDTFRYWDRTYALKEAYRAKTRLGVSGRETVMPGTDAIAALRAVVAVVDAGTAKCLKRYGTYVTYFMNDPVSWTPVKGTRTARITAFRQVPLPLYLEGFVHALRVEGDRRIPEMVRKSGLFDSKLGMYRVNAPLGDFTNEIGRAKTFPRGWLENESIWLHMEYKYLLELLRAGLYDEFFRDFRKCVVAFMDPAVYRRSILENCSFLVGSGYPDPDRHGRGFVARLTGASAEFVDIWVRMTSGKAPFTLDEDGILEFRLAPVLPAWLFQDGVFEFRFLGSTDVTYLNLSRRNTWEGLRPISYRITSDGRETTVSGESLGEPWASLIRDRKVSKLVATLG